MPFHASLVLANTEAGRGLREGEAGGDGICISLARGSAASGEEVVVRATGLPPRHPHIVGAQGWWIHNSCPRAGCEGVLTPSPLRVTMRWQLVQSLALPNACRRLSCLQTLTGEGPFLQCRGDFGPWVYLCAVLWWSPGLGSESLPGGRTLASPGHTGTGPQEGSSHPPLGPVAARRPQKEPGLASSLFPSSNFFSLI